MIEIFKDLKANEEILIQRVAYGVRVSLITTNGGTMQFASINFSDEALQFEKQMEGEVQNFLEQSREKMSRMASQDTAVINSV